MSGAIGTLAIGTGAIGTGAIGDAGPVDVPDSEAPLTPFAYSRTIISQYANSPVLLALIGAFAAAVDPSSNINAFYSDMWNVATASGYGLDVWGRIVGVTRVLTVPPSNDFGFFEAGTASAVGFGQGPFYSQAASSGNYALADTAFRTLILVKALSNITGVSAGAVNTALLLLFAGRGVCFSVDLGGMQMMLSFGFALLPYEVAILTQSNAIFRPSGVGLWIYQPDAAGRFGFAGTGDQPFGQGTFAGDAISAV